MWTEGNVCEGKKQPLEVCQPAGGFQQGDHQPQPSKVRTARRGARSPSSPLTTLGKHPACQVSVSSATKQGWW